MPIAKRLRGVLGISIVWGVSLASVATSLLVGGLMTHLVPSSVFGPREIVQVAIRGMLFGAMAGAMFSTFLTTIERQRTLATLSRRRVGLWGFVGASTVPLVVAATTGVLGLLPLGVMIAGSSLIGVMGAAMSVATIGLARRSPAQLSVDPELARLRAP